MISKEIFYTDRSPSATYITTPAPVGSEAFVQNKIFVNESGDEVILCSINGNYDDFETRWVVSHGTANTNDHDAIEHFGLKDKIEGERELKVISEAEQKTILATIKQTVQNVYGVRVDKAYDMRKKAPRECKVVEAAFLAGCATILVPSGRCLPPAWDVCRMCGRSIFTLEPFSKTEGAA